METATLIKHSLRTNRKPCNRCLRGGEKDATLDLYWAHDPTGPKTGRRYCSAHDSASWVLMERDGTPHNMRCTNPKPVSGLGPEEAPDDADDVAETPAAPVMAPYVPTVSPQPTNGHGDERLDAMARLLDLMAPKVDANQVHEIVNARMAEVIAQIDKITSAPHIDVRWPDGTVKPISGKIAHPVLARLIRVVGNARRHVLMVGPAGTGKSTLAHQVAEALSLDFYPVSVGPMTSKADLLGYMNATGDYVETIVYRAFKHGGLLLLDEMDAGNPGVFTILNGMLANGVMAFPNSEIVTRHPDFRCIAAANTYGRGPDRMYIGRQAMDAATLDRLAVVTVDIDEKLETAICEATGLPQSSVMRVLSFVRAIRSNAYQHKMAVVVSPRASEGMCALLASGDTVAEAIESCVRKGISDADWTKLTAGVQAPSAIPV